MRESFSCNGCSSRGWLGSESRFLFGFSSMGSCSNIAVAFGNQA